MTTKNIAFVLPPIETHWVGDGFKVHNFIPAAPDLSMEEMDPFIMLDYNSPMTVRPSEQPAGVGVHPHRGFETVTLAYSGKVEHHDSAGGGGIIGTGDVQWMTAASGVLHKEFYEKEWAKKGGTFHMVQLWTNLPAKDKMSSPRYQAITNDSMGRYDLGDSSFVEVIAGDYQGVKGPAKTHSPIHLMNARLLKAGAKATFDFPASYNTGLLVVKGAAKVNGTAADTDSFVKFGHEGETFTVEATMDDTVILVMSGEPLNEPIAAYGPFVMNTREELMQAFKDFNEGKFGYLAD